MSDVHQIALKVVLAISSTTLMVVIVIVCELLLPLELEPFLKLLKLLILKWTALQSSITLNLLTLYEHFYQSCPLLAFFWSTSQIYSNDT